MIQLIALDLDGTTLTGDNVISERNRNALLEAMAQGVLVVPATGRTFEKMPSCIRELPGIQYAICSNGAAVYDVRADRNIYENLMPYETVAEMLRFGDEYKCFPEVYLKGRSYCRLSQLDLVMEYPRLSDYAAHVKSTRLPVESLRRFVLDAGCGVEKVNLWPKRREDFPVMWGQLLENQAVSITSSGFGNIEINAHGCDKGDVLLHLCEYLTISRENVMAAGDNLNDGPMLRFAGESVAMGNAIDDVKNIAKYIAKTNLEDGVAEMVERLVLKKEI